MSARGNCAGFSRNVALPWSPCQKGRQLSHSWKSQCKEGKKDWPSVSRIDPCFCFWVCGGPFCGFVSTTYLDNPEAAQLRQWPVLPSRDTHHLPGEDLSSPKKGSLDVSRAACHCLIPTLPFQGQTRMPDGFWGLPLLVLCQGSALVWCWAEMSLTKLHWVGSVPTWKSGP